MLEGLIWHLILQSQFISLHHSWLAVSFKVGWCLSFGSQYYNWQETLVISEIKWNLVKYK
jgi:hypothetical protein